MNGEESKSDVDSQQVNVEELPGDKHESNNYQKRKKSASHSRTCQQLKVPELELKVFDHPFPYGLSLPSDVIKQASLSNTNYYKSLSKI